MKRTIPLLITAMGGILLIIATFIPATKDWGEKATIWFDILAGIAFILGGANLLVIHLGKVSDRKKGWGYSLITLLSFLTMLFVGMFKIGSPPAPDQEYYGESFVSMTMKELPDLFTFSVDGSWPPNMEGDAELPASVRTQMSIKDGQMTIRGWMRENQFDDLIDFSDNLKWRSDVEKLFDASQPPESDDEEHLPIAWYSDMRSLGYKGEMTDSAKQGLLKVSDAPKWVTDINALFELTNRETSVEVPEPLRSYLQQKIAQSPDVGATGSVSFSGETGVFSSIGEMSLEERNYFQHIYPVPKPMNQEQKETYWNEFLAAGDREFGEDVKIKFMIPLNNLWTKEVLVGVINAAGKGKPKKKTWTQLYEEQQSGVTNLDPNLPAPPSIELNETQLQAVDQFIADQDMTTGTFLTLLREGGEFRAGQAAATIAFLDGQTTRGQLGREIAEMMMGTNVPLQKSHYDFLLEPYREEVNWSRIVDNLFVKAHVVKYPFSGEYSATGTPFWWIYEYMMQPLMATVFALLAFYVASAAFRAFRVKNVEASLLLGTAFIILLGRTFAGVWLTSWIDPEGPFAVFRIENLTVWIMSVVNTAGNRAILLGIALGIISTSLKVLLGVDRSYLGSDD